MSDCPICDGTGTDPDHDPCDCDEGTPCPKCPECNGTGTDPENRCDFCDEPSEDGCHRCEVHWCFEHRHDHECGCVDCGITERVYESDGKCEWCRAEDAGYPHGQCNNCMGARASDGTCACRPPEKED